MKRPVLITLVLLTGLVLSACGSGNSAATLTPTTPPTTAPTVMPSQTFTLPPTIPPATETETPPLAETLSETLTPTPAESVTAGPSETATLTPIPLPLVNTSRGDYTVNSIQSVDRFPLGCSGANCSLIAPSNFQVLVITLERVSPDFASGNFMLDRVYVQTADGSQGILLAETISLDKQQEFLAFELPATYLYISLYWPGNQPIPLVVPSQGS